MCLLSAHGFSWILVGLLFKVVSRFYDYWLALMIFQGSFTFFHGFGQLFLVVFVQQYPIQAEQQQSKTLGTSQNVPT